MNAPASASRTSASGAPAPATTWVSDVSALGFFLGLSALAATAGSVFTTPAIGTWYATLIKPPWTPPNAAFPIVWPILFVLMAVAAWLVWRVRGERGAALALALYGVQLGLNVLWSLLFFGLQRPDLAFVEVVVFWLAIALTLLAFARVRLSAGLLLLPYLAWVGFAAALNFSIWRLNP